MPQKETLGLVGVGTMGILVVQSLTEAGYPFYASDPVPAAQEAARALGAEVVETPAAVAAASDIILLLLPGPPQIKTVVSGPNGVIAGASPGSTIIDMSTVDPSTTRRMASEAAKHGIDYLDVPILGRPSAHGNWVLPAGGDPDVLARCRPILEHLGREVIHVGPLGAGNTLKLLNAMMFSAINAMTAEMMAISQKAGMAPEVLFNTISSSEAATVSGLFKEVGSKIVARDFDAIFPIDLLCKDNGLAVAMARDYGAPPVLGGVIQTINELGKSQGLGSEDTSALVKVYESMLAVEEADA
jgi:3-hydroxyisobutyrate dehydrogenase-like beta-hydroxyacid dehydrogenase